MPVEIENEFAKEEAERRRIEEKNKEQKEFGDLIVKAVQPFFKENVLFEINEYSSVVGYKIRRIIPKNGFLSRTKKLLIAQVARYTGVDPAYNFELVVFQPDHEKLAREIAAIFPLVYGDKIRIRIVHDEVSW
jgi:hypothetical protein